LGASARDISPSAASAFAAAVHPTVHRTRDLRGTQVTV
jgi:hypothetical protein